MAALALLFEVLAQGCRTKNRGQRYPRRHWGCFLEVALGLLGG